MWALCKSDYSKWNRVVGSLEGYHKYIDSSASLSVYFDPQKVIPQLQRRGCTADFDGGFLRTLEMRGLINGLTFSPTSIAFSYKDIQTKRCLTCAGRILELIVTVTAQSVNDTNGKPYFDDVLTGVTIDWDGHLELSQQDVDNEIDVVLMKELTPIFISCKNGKNFKSDELYKLSTVAERFGGQYAKKVLVATRLDEMGDNGQGIVNRAKDMGITVIDLKNDDLCEQRLAQALRMVKQ
jgi:hypothetical protein